MALIGVYQLDDLPPLIAALITERPDGCWVLSKNMTLKKGRRLLADARVDYRGREVGLRRLVYHLLCDTTFPIRQHRQPGKKRSDRLERDCGSYLCCNPAHVWLPRRVKRVPLPRVIRDAVIARDHGICGYCGDPADQIDHIIPVCRLPDGADHNDMDNLTAACGRCNMRKAREHPKHFMEERRKYGHTHRPSTIGAALIDRAAA